MVTKYFIVGDWDTTWVEKIASFDRGWLPAVPNVAMALKMPVEKIASFDRGWLLTVCLSLCRPLQVVEKIASFDRGWLLVELGTQCFVWVEWRK